MAQIPPYTIVESAFLSVSPAHYLDQPTTFIVNRSTGADAVISFEDYSALEDRGKHYCIKNVGANSAIVTSSAGALFDGETSVTLPPFGSITIMSFTLPTGSTAVHHWALMSDLSAIETLRVLTLVVNGLPTNVDVFVNGVVWPDRKKAFPLGTVLTDLVVTALAYNITPALVPEVIMDADKSLNFNATASDEPILTIVVNGLAEGYEVAANNVVWPDHKKAFPSRTVLENLEVTVEDYDIIPSSVLQVILDSDKTLTFTGTSQGFSPINIQWETAHGGGMEAGVTRTGNSLFRVSGSSANKAWAGCTLGPGITGSLKFNLHEGLFGILKDTEVVNGQNSFAYGVKTESTGQIYAIAWLNSVDSVYVLLRDQAHPQTIEIEFTATEVIWYYGDHRIEWNRAPRKIFNYYVGCEVYTSIENIRQKGLV
uniref:hypothetical protein n=1 Tax=Pedobacter schmidteae TaxID=2201271 RepID=UPI000EB5C3D3|nr:hypothetical protein [Pedobacter schmidteae]